MSKISKKYALAKRLAPKINLSITDSEILLDDVFDTFEESLLETGEVTIGKLGAIKLVDRAERAGRNPQTGEKITIPAKTATKYTPSKYIKEKLKN